MSKGEDTNDIAEAGDDPVRESSEEEDEKKKVEMEGSQETADPEEMKDDDKIEKVCLYVENTSKLLEKLL